MDILFKILGCAVPILLVIFIVISIILFIKDGKRAKRDGTGRKLSYTVIFIIGMAIVHLTLLAVITLCVLSVLIMYGM